MNRFSIINICVRATFVIVLAGLLANCATGLDYSQSAVHQGRADAQADLRAGKLATESFGKSFVFQSIHHRLLKQRYGIDSRVVGGCLVDDRIVGHARGYNEVMQSVIRRRFGSDVFERTATDARQIYYTRKSS